MASITCTTTKHPTLSGTTADTVTIAPTTNLDAQRVVLTNDGAVNLYYTLSGTTAVSAADGTFHVKPGESLVLPTRSNFTFSIVGNGNLYHVEIIPRHL